MIRRALIVPTLLVAFAPSLLLAAPPASLATQKPKPKPPSSAATVSEEETRPPASSAIVHEVVRGETLGAIAKKYKVSVATIVIANRLRGSRAKLTAGQRLKIPHPGAAPVLRARRGPADQPLPATLVLALPEFDEAPGFLWPVTGPVTSTFGRRKRGWHRGLDIRADGGTPIMAAAHGVVVASGFEPRYGQRVTIEHDGGFATVYAHNERNLVEVGQTVTAGQVIAVVGRTGRATGEHLHFEIRHEGRVYNPLYLLPLPPRPVTVDLTNSDEHDDDE